MISPDALSALADASPDPTVPLLRYMQQMKLTQRDLALKCNVSTSYINQMLSGARPITTDLACRMELKMPGLSALEILILQTRKDIIKYGKVNK